MINNCWLIGEAVQSNKVLSIIPLIKRIVRAFQPVSAKLGFPASLSYWTMDKTLYDMCIKWRVIYYGNRDTASDRYSYH